mmetsp:Transcript_37772/g.70806  ORF Transcript_37772/g.70806 Transcript_37772/m.70806 type:complete len:667 (-) Transcript_37772:193-2193(-)
MVPLCNLQGREQEMSGDSGDPLLSFPDILVKNTFLHCKVASSAHSRRSTSCPPRHPWKLLAAAAAVGTDGYSHTADGEAAEEDAGGAGSSDLAAQCSSPGSEAFFTPTALEGSCAQFQTSQTDCEIASASTASTRTVKCHAPKPNDRSCSDRGALVPGGQTDAEVAGRGNAEESLQAAADQPSTEAPSLEHRRVRNAPLLSRTSRAPRSLDMARLMSLIARGPPPYAPPALKSRLDGDRLPPEDTDCGADASDSAVIQQSGEAVSCAHPASPEDADATELAEPTELAGEAPASASPETSSNDPGEWAVVETRRKKRASPGKPQTSQGSEEAEGRQPAEYLHGISATPRVGHAGGANSLIHHQLEVGIADDAEFRVVKRLIGIGGENMKRITSECPGTKVELRGAGTKSPSHDTGDESGPLVLHIKGHDAAQCARALSLASQLLTDVKKEHEGFLARDVAAGTSQQVVTDQLASLGELKGKSDSDRACDNLSSPEDSTSADDSAAAPHLHDATDSDADELIGGDLSSRSPSTAAQRLAAEEGGKAERRRPAGSSSPAAASAAAAPMIHHELPVGIEQSTQFSVVRRLIGPGGENMKYITGQCPGTKVELRGEGTNPWSGGESGPLVLHVRGRDAEQCTAALGLATELIADVRKEYQQLVESKENRLT